MDAPTAPIIDDSLPNDVGLLRTMVRELQLQLHNLNARYDRLKDDFDKLERRFSSGNKSERFSPDQLRLFDIPPEPQVAPSPEADKPRRRCRPHGRRRIPEDLPRDVCRIEPTESERACPCCGLPRFEIDIEVSERLEYTPAKMRVLRHERPKLACSVCLNRESPENRAEIAGDPEPSLESEPTETPPVAASDGDSPPSLEAEVSVVEPEPEVSTESNMSNGDSIAPSELEVSMQSNMSNDSPVVGVDTPPADPRRGDPSQWSPSELIYTVPMPPMALPKSMAGPGLLAYIITSKYADHLPLHRLESIIARMGVNISRSTMCDWMADCATLLTPIYTWMLGQVLQSRCIHLDETRLPVQQPGQLKSGRLWVYAGDKYHPYICYDYRPDKSRAGPEEILKDYRGFIQADAANVFDQLYARDRIVEVGCWAHMRRHFRDALTGDAVRAAQALARIQGFYEVERKAKEEIAKQGLSGDAAEMLVLQMRQQRTTPLLNDFAAWIESERMQVLPKSPFGQAIAYAQRHWQALKRFTEQGFLQIDNNTAERSFRAVALGRRNYLFAGSDKGGQTASVLYSLTQTCKLHKRDPFEYLRDVLTNYPIWLANLEPPDGISRFAPRPPALSGPPPTA